MFERYFWPCPECKKMCKRTLNIDYAECGDHGIFSIAIVEKAEAEEQRREICPHVRSSAKDGDAFPSNELLIIGGNTVVVP